MQEVSSLEAELPTALALGKCKLLQQMRENPKGDWTISDIESVCRQIGLILKPPSNGSHYKARSPHLTGMLTIPARRPIKVPYIKNFISLADAHCEAVKSKGEG